MKRGNVAIQNKIVEVIQKGLGRIQACKAAKLNYQTFLNWLNPEHPNFDLDFLETIKKAESEGLQTIKETCESVILKAATRENVPAWQAAAWMLERKFKNEYSLKTELDHSSTDGSMSPMPKEVADSFKEYLEWKSKK